MSNAIYFGDGVVTAHFDNKDLGSRELLDAPLTKLSFEIEDDGQGFLEIYASDHRGEGYESYTMRAYVSRAQAKQALAAMKAWVEIYEAWDAEPVNDESN